MKIAIFHNTSEHRQEKTNQNSFKGTASRYDYYGCEHGFFTN